MRRGEGPGHRRGRGLLYSAAVSATLMCGRLAIVAFLPALRNEGVSSMTRRPRWWLAVPLALTILLLGAAPALAAHAVKVSPKNMHGWVFFDDNNGAPGSGQL